MTVLASASAVHPAWLAAAWPALSGVEAGLLLGCGRVQARLAELLACRLGWEDGPRGDGALAGLAEAPASRLDEAAALAGAVWHAASIRMMLEVSEVGRLVEAVGTRVRAFALAHAALAAAPAERVDAAGLCVRMAVAGRMSLSAWLAALPPGSRRLAAIRLPPDVVGLAVTPAEAACALRIMAVVAAEVLGAGGH